MLLTHNAEFTEEQYERTIQLLSITGEPTLDDYSELCAVVLEASVFFDFDDASTQEMNRLYEVIQFMSMEMANVEMVACLLRTTTVSKVIKPWRFNIINRIKSRIPKEEFDNIFYQMEN